jgi:hypothetical protein
MSQGCEAIGCLEVAWYRVEAWWSVADFDSMYVCFDHLVAAERYYYSRWVEGRAPYVDTFTLPVEDTIP